MIETRQCVDLDKEIESLTNEGYRLDVLTPADAPREVQLSKNEDVIRLILSRNGVEDLPPKGGTPSAWIAGRIGMMYRDLIPGRLGGKLIASHIRLTEGGPVPDYVHYHKVDFQLIYCLRGRIKVVYEDQGPPFWLEPGDCVLQPPEIRHRVLECEAGSEVLELSSPAEHETWVDHEMALPTAEIDARRVFSGQRFVRSVAKDAEWQPTQTDGVELRHTGTFAATNGLLDITVRRTAHPESISAFSPRPGMTALGFVVAGKARPDARSPSSPIAVSDSSASTMTEILRIEFQDATANRLADH
jgi:quercetin dioxygenase-like cupin family protein